MIAFCMRQQWCDKIAREDEGMPAICGSIDGILIYWDETDRAIFVEIFGFSGEFSRNDRSHLL